MSDAARMIIREVEYGDLAQLLQLYTHLHDTALPHFDENLETIWSRILADPNHHIFVGIVDGQIISSCVLIIVPNLTHNQQPYAFIENVVTHQLHRNKGYASQVLDFAKQLAVRRHCYKIMLMTGSKLESTWRFYEKAGYNRMDKTAFIQWL